MVTRYDVISSRWSNHFWVKINFFQLFWTIEVKTRWWNYTKCFFMYYFTYRQKTKLPFISILTWFLIHGKIQDGDHYWWRHWPPAAPPPVKYTLSCWEDQRLASKGKIVSKHCDISKILGRDSINLPLPPYITVGVWICMYVRGLKSTFAFEIHCKKGG